MYPVIRNFSRPLAACCLLLISTFCFAQADSQSPTPVADSFPHHKPTLAGAIIRLAVCEGFFAGMSSAASNTKDHGDKIIGWTYTGFSAGMLTLSICEWFNRHNRLDSSYKVSRISNAITMLGITYGFSRIATYNLIQANGDSRNKRFTRNLIEQNGAYIVPIIAGSIVNHLLSRKPHPNKKVQSNVYFDGRNVGLLLTFK